MPKVDFHSLDQVTYLATGQAAPVLVAQKVGYAKYLTDRSKGLKAKQFYDRVANQVRLQLASRLRCQADEIAFLGNASQAISLVASATRLDPGDNVVVEDLEYSSTALPWFSKQSSGVEIRIAPSSIKGQGIQTLAECLDVRTRVICISHVSYFTGYRYDLHQLSQLAQECGARLIVDASQSLGVVPVHAYLADAVVSCAHKWLLGPHGIGILAWNRNRWPDLCPSSAGWHSAQDIHFPLDGSYRIRNGARRFEFGCLPYPNLYVLHECLSSLFRFSEREIEAHVLSLGDQLTSELERLHYDLLTPLEREYRGGNVCFAVDDSEGLQSRLEDEGTQIVGGQGRARVSVHLFNDSNDVDNLLALLRRKQQ